MHESSQFHFHTQRLISMCYSLLEDVQTVVCCYIRFLYVLKVVFLGGELEVCISIISFLSDCFLCDSYLMFLKYDSVYFPSRTSRYPFEHVHYTAMFCDNVVNGLRP